MTARARLMFVVCSWSACTSSATTELPRDASVAIADAAAADAAAPASDAEPAPLDAAAADAAVEPDAGAAPLDVLDQLRAVPGLEVIELASRVEGTRAFQLWLEQPEDHAAPDGVTFRQRIMLIHRSTSAPMVLHTTGYGLFGDPGFFTEYVTEPAQILEANQVTVEHRFFGESIAASPTWSRLTIEQSAGDSHRVVQRLGTVYPGAWVATGASKGGMTALFHQRFFPDDLAASVPYVAPISFRAPFADEDTRYLAWLAQIGPADGACRDRVLDMEVELVERRSEVAAYHQATDPVAAAVRPEVLEALVTYPAFGFHWAFWQYWGSEASCAALEPRGGPVEWLAAWFPFDPSYLVGWGFDPELSPYAYQVANELASQAIAYDHLAAAVGGVDYSVVPEVMVASMPWGDDPAFDPAPIRGVSAFLARDARRLLAIYGSFDPWTGGRITVDEANDAEVVTVYGQPHSAAIADLSTEEQERLFARLRGWVGRSELRAGDHPRLRAALAAARPLHERVVALSAAADRAVLRGRRPRE